MNIIKGFLAVSLFTVVPVRLYALSVSLQGTFSAGLTGYGRSIGEVGQDIITELNEIHAHIAHEGKKIAEKAYGLPIDPVHELIQDCRGDKVPNKYCSFTSGDATRPPPFRATALTAVFTYFIVCPKLWVSLLSGSYPSFWQTKP